MQLPTVTFELKPVVDRDFGEATGRPVRDAEFVVFRQPGDRFTIVEKEVTPEEIRSWSEQPHKHHVPALYDAWKRGLDLPESGTHVRDWPAVSPAQVHQALAVGIRTVEEFAQLNDEGLRAFGHGALLLKQKAKLYLDSQNDHGKVVEKVANQEATIAALTEQMQAQAAQMQAMQALLAQTEAEAVVEAAKPDAKAKK